MSVVKVGERLPPLSLGRLGLGGVESVDLERMLSGRRAVLVGVPGAFTPVCTQEHVPSFVAQARALRQSGIDLVACVAPNDPWTLQAWADRLDAEGSVTFMSDGNLDLGRALGVLSTERSLYLGIRPGRYLLVLRNAVVERFKVEPNALALTCTRPDDVMLEA